MSLLDLRSLEEAGTVAVGSSQALSWEVRATAGASSSLTWRVAATAGASRALSWEVRATAGASRALTWRVRAVADAPRALSWRVAVVAGSSRPLSWQVLAGPVHVAVGVSQPLSWAVQLQPLPLAAVVDLVRGAVVGSSLELGWRVRRRVRSDALRIQLVRQPSPASSSVGSELELSWQVRAGVTIRLRASWIVRPTFWELNRGLLLAEIDDDLLVVTENREATAA